MKTISLATISMLLALAAPPSHAKNAAGRNNSFSARSLVGRFRLVERYCVTLEGNFDDSTQQETTKRQKPADREPESTIVSFSADGYFESVSVFGGTSYATRGSYAAEEIKPSGYRHWIAVTLKNLASTMTNFDKSNVYLEVDIPRSGPDRLVLYRCVADEYLFARLVNGDQSCEHGKLGSDLALVLEREKQDRPERRSK